MVVLVSRSTEWPVPNKVERWKDEDEMTSGEMPELLGTCRACSFTSQPCAAREAALPRLGGCCWHHCSPPGCVVLYCYIPMCVSETVKVGGSEIEIRVPKITLIARFCQLLAPVVLHFPLMPIISLRTITVSWSKTIYNVVWVQICSAPVHSWYRCFAEHRFICVISPPFVEIPRIK